MERRTFIKKTSTGLAAAWALSYLPQQLLAQSKFLGIPIGFQSWTVRDKLSKDFAATLKSIAAQGYQMVEMCSPKGYEQIGFGPLTKMKASEMRSIITDAGLSCPSCHFGFGEFKNNLDERIEWSKEMGLELMVLSTFWLPKTATLKDYLDAADQLNLAGEKIKKAGMQAAFHNHDFEFAKLDGQLIYDALLGRFDSELVKLQFQTQVIVHGYKAADYFTKYPDRFVSAHLSDWTDDKKETAIGKGMIDWKEFFEAAKKGGVKYFFVEMAPDKFKDSASYIKGL
jgi:sugar phosphate isomerase/epimerase